MSSGSSSFGAWFEQVKAASGDAASAGAAGNDGEKTGRPGAGGGFFGGMRGLWRSEDGDGGQPAAADGTDEESGGLLGMSFSRGGSTAKAKGGMGDCASLTRTQRLQGFTVLVLGGGSLLAVALFVFLPFPTKFSLCFTVGSLMFMGAFALLRGPMAYMRHLMSKDRLVFTSTYLGSMALTLYAALSVQSTLLVMFASAVQVLALAWYGISYIPGGSRGMKLFSQFALRSMRTLCWPCMQATTKACAQCCKPGSGGGGGSGV